MYNGIFSIEKQLLNLNDYTDILHDINLSISVGKFGNLSSMVGGLPKAYHFFSHWWTYEIGKTISYYPNIGFILVTKIIIWPMLILTLFFISESFIKNSNITDYTILLANIFIGLIFCYAILEIHHYSGVITFMFGLIIFLPIFFFILNNKISNIQYVFYIFCGLILTSTKTNFGFNLLTIIILKIYFDEKSLKKKITLTSIYCIIFLIFFIFINPHSDNKLKFEVFAFVCTFYKCNISYYLQQSVLPIAYLFIYLFKIFIKQKSILNQKQLLILFLYFIVNYFPGLIMHVDGQALAYLSMPSHIIFVILIAAELNTFYKTNSNKKKFFWVLNLLFFLITLIIFIAVSTIDNRKIAKEINATSFSNTTHKYISFSKNFKTIIGNNNYPLILRGNFDIKEIFTISSITGRKIFFNNLNQTTNSPDMITFRPCNSIVTKMYAYFGFYENIEYLCGEYEKLNSFWGYVIKRQVTNLETNLPSKICNYIKKLNYKAIYILNEELTEAKLIKCK